MKPDFCFCFFGIQDIMIIVLLGNFIRIIDIKYKKKITIKNIHFIHILLLK